MNNNNQVIKCIEWQKIARQGKQKNGKVNTQLEITLTMLSVSAIMSKLHAQLVV